MKRTIIAASLALASLTSHAEWDTVKSDNGNVSAISPSAINGIGHIIGVAFDAYDNCRARLKYLVIADYDEPIEIGAFSVTNISAHLRVDTNEHWTAQKTQVAMSDNVVNHDIGPISAEAVGELMTGNIARLKIDTGDTIYDRFSLKGSAKAISKARSMCKPINDSDFFEKPQMNEDAKYFRGA